MKHDELSSEFYLGLVRHSAALLSVVDGAGIYKYVSNSVQRLTGYGPEELLGKAALEYIHNEDLQGMKAAFALLHTQSEVSVPSFRLRTKEGSWRWMEAVISDATGDEFVNGYVIDARDITVRKEALSSLEQSHNFYTSLFQAHPDAIFTLTPGGVFDKVNSSICRILSYGKSEIVGQHFSRFIAPSFAFEANKALNMARNCEAAALEGKVVSKHGKTKILDFTIIPICTDQALVAILGIARDVTAERKALKELEKLSLIASKAVSCVVITDAAGRVEWVNSEFTKVTGYSMVEAIGKKPGELLQGPETDPNHILAMKRLFEENEPISLEILNYRRNGEKFWFYMDISPIFNDEGRVSQYFAIQYDVTERKEAEKKMRRLSEDLTRHNRELHQFNYIVSHNLRAPVANIVGLVSLLEHMDDKNESFLKVLQKLRETSQNLSTVIKDLDEILSLRDSSTGGFDEEVCIGSICGEVVRSLQDRIEEAAATVQVDVPDDACLQANRAYVYSIFHNLLSNSLKYRDPGRPLHISITYAAEGRQHLILFRDNGKGIDLAKFGNDLFKLYGKIDKRAEGRGIGLYMVKAQVETLGGTIGIESTPGVGTTFYLRFGREEA